MTTKPKPKPTPYHVEQFSLRRKIELICLDPTCSLPEVNTPATPVDATEYTETRYKLMRTARHHAEQTGHRVVVEVINGLVFDHPHPTTSPQ